MHHQPNICKNINNDFAKELAQQRVACKNLQICIVIDNITFHEYKDVHKSLLNVKWFNLLKQIST